MKIININKKKIELVNKFKEYGIINDIECKHIVHFFENATLDELEEVLK